MNFELNAANIVRTLIYIVSAVAAFVVLIRILKFFAGVIFGFVVTLLLAYLYFRL
ncbi:MAG: hypothetical protein IKB74_03065 [Lentisphaeria bacterium]|nr:hypothetical protein [Lentisphaeria bacterium]